MVKAPAEIMKIPRSAASIRYSGQFFRNDLTADKRRSGRASGFPLRIDGLLPESLQEMIADAQRIGDGGQRGVYRSNAAKKTRVHDI